MCGQSQKTSQNSTYTPTAQASGLYSNIIGQATNAAQTPYNPATGKTVADFSGLQQQAFTGVQNAQGTGQGALDAAGNLIAQGAAPISAAQIQNYQDPYQQQVINAAIAQMNQQNGVQQSSLAGNAAAQQALGGNRVGVAQANLAGEQGRNANSMVSGLLSQGYQSALGAAQQDAQRQQTAAGQQMNLGQLQQGMAYNDLQALLQAGNQQQAQGQAQNDAASANASAQTMWPYQNAQWLAGIGSAIGPLTGGKTTGSSTTSQGKGIGQILGAGLSAAAMMPSDRRAKEDVKHIGKSFDGQNIYSFRYKGSPKVQMGLMADEVAQSHPQAVGQHPSGMQMVDYGAATDDSAQRGHFASGGGVDFGSLGGMWNELRPSQPMMPQLTAAPAMQQEQQQTPQQSVALGKSARAGIDNVLRQLSPTKGWASGTSIEPTAGAAAGKGAGGLSGLFGFAPGGGVRLDRAQHALPGAPEEIPQSQEPRWDLDQFHDFPMALGDKEFLTPPPADRPIQPGRAMPEGYAPGGTVDFQGLLPHRNLPLTDENIGQVGESGIQQPESSWGMRGIVPTYGGKSLADWLGFQPPAPPVDVSAEAMPTSEALPEPGRDPAIYAGASPVPGMMEGLHSPAPQSIGQAGASGIPQPMPATPGGMSIGDANVDLIENAPWATAPKTQDRLEIGPADIVTRFSPEVNAAIGSASSEFGVDPRLLSTFAQIESSGIPDASTGSYHGLFQMSESEFRKYGGGDIYNPVDNARAGALKLRAESEEFARKYGRPPEPWELYLTHQQGEGGFAKHQGNPEGLAWQNMASTGEGRRKGPGWARAAIWGNIPDDAKRQFGSVDNVTSADFMQLWRDKVARIGGEAGQSATRGAPAVADGDPGAAGAAPSVAPQVAAGLVQRATDPGAQPTGGYTGKKDKAVGGFLKSMFGIEFNPLNLEENERMALLAAGLSMMSNGDIGGGGLAGLGYLQKMNAADRDALRDAQTLALDMEKTRRLSEGKWSPSAGGEIVVNDATGETRRTGHEKQDAPTATQKEYEQAREQGFTGSLLEYQQAAKDAKSATGIPAEVGARIGLGDAFQGEVPTLRKRLEAWTNQDRVDLKLGRGEAAEVWRGIEGGRDALVRHLTGAGIGVAEAQNQADRYQISATDGVPTMLKKLDRLSAHLEAVKQGAINAKTGATARNPKPLDKAAPSAARPRARNAAGDVVEYDGSAWVPAP